MATKNTENVDAAFYYSLGKNHIDYEDSWLTLHKGNYCYRALIGTIGLFETGLHLCNVASGREDRYGGYSHIDGVFHISAGEGYICFTEGNKEESIKISNSKLLDLGLSLVQLGHQINTDFTKARFGGRLTFTKVPA